MKKLDSQIFGVVPKVIRLSPEMAKLLDELKTILGFNTKAKTIRIAIAFGWWFLKNSRTSRIVVRNELKMLQEDIVTPFIKSTKTGKTRFDSSFRFELTSQHNEILRKMAESSIEINESSIIRRSLVLLDTIARFLKDGWVLGCIEGNGRFVQNNNLLNELSDPIDMYLAESDSSKSCTSSLVNENLIEDLALAERTSLELIAVEKLLNGGIKERERIVGLMSDSIKRMKQLRESGVAIDDSRFINEDLEGFHGSLLGIGTYDHERVKHLVRNVLHNTMIIVRKGLTSQETTVRFIEEHAQIVDAIRNGDRLKIEHAYRLHLQLNFKKPDERAGRRGYQYLSSDLICSLKPGDSFFVFINSEDRPREFEWLTELAPAIANRIRDDVSFFYVSSNELSEGLFLEMQSEFYSLKDKVSDWLEHSCERSGSIVFDRGNIDQVFRSCNVPSDSFPVGLHLQGGRVCNMSYWRGSSLINQLDPVILENEDLVAFLSSQFLNKKR
jgi:DNA-binding FadR family transcriptional regulator